MSGRSAYVRKEKTKEKDLARQQSAYQSELVNSQPHSEISTIRTNSSGGNEDLAYQRVRKPHVPVLDVSGIEKSTFRTLMDKRSEGVRKGLGNVFGGKKKKDSERSESAQNIRTESHELDAGEYPLQTSLAIRPQRHQVSEPDYIRSTSSGRLTAVPQTPSFKRWIGNGRPPVAWSKLQKDPELYEPQADTQIFLSHQSENKPPSMIISSSIIELTGSRHLQTILRQGLIDETEQFHGMPPSPANSPDFRTSFPVTTGRHRHPSPPISDRSYAVDGHTSYKIYMPAPHGLTEEASWRYLVTTRNVFAVIFGKSLCGNNLFQALSDLYERLVLWMPEDSDPAQMIVDYLGNKGLDDIRYNPPAAAALLGFYELPAVQNVEGWREAYIHACGLWNQIEASEEDCKHISYITKAMLAQCNLDIEVKVTDCEVALSQFDFDHVWSAHGLRNIAHPDSVGRSAFNRLSKLFVEHYASRYGSWPPTAKNQQDQWLTRIVARELATDFAALYDYLVNREVIWDSSEERSGRKWHIVHPGYRFEADSEDFQFTDLIVAFDNARRYPHIPCPYPLTPPETLSNFSPRENFMKSNKKDTKQVDEKLEKMAEKKAALEYTNATNIFRFGTAFVTNPLVEAFCRFEKSDQLALHDPYNARRGRWVLIYCILQTLASISVDTPDLKYTDVDYYLNPKLAPNLPPWRVNNQAFPEATHTLSHCWTIRASWQTPASQPMNYSNRPQTLLTGLATLSERGNSNRSGAPSIASSDAGSSMRSPTLTNMSVKSKRSNRNVPGGYDGASYTGYAPGIEKVDDWHTFEQGRYRYEEKSPKTSSREPSRTRKRENSRSRSNQNPSPLIANSQLGPFEIKDFDDWPERDDWAGRRI